MKEYKAKMKVKKSVGEHIFDAAIIIIMLILMFMVLYPLIHLVAVSFSNPNFIRDGSVGLIPVGFNTKAYHLILGDSQIYKAYGSTIFVCAMNCLLSIVLLCFAAYPLAYGNFRSKGLFSKFIILTMFLSAGIIPNLVVVKALHLDGSLWSLVLTGLLSAYNIIVVRSYFEGLPKALIESARVDGANDFQILFRIIIPCSKPILAAVALWIIVAQWNSYMYPLIYLGNKATTLQIYLANAIKDAAALYDTGGLMIDDAFATQLRYAAVVCSIIPILIIFPFAQKFLVKGVTVGSVKE